MQNILEISGYVVSFGFPFIDGKNFFVFSLKETELCDDKIYYYIDCQLSESKITILKAMRSYGEQIALSFSYHDGDKKMVMLESVTLVQLLG